MRPLLLNLAIATAFLTATSCVEDIDMGQDTERKVTVNCILSGNDDIQYADLKYTGGIGDIFYESVEDADIVLYENGIEAGTFIKTGDGRWMLEYHPTAETAYTIRINITGYPQITASTVLPAPVKIEKSSDAYVQKGFQAAFWTFGLTNGQKLVERISTDHPDVDNFNIYTDGSDGHIGYLRIGSADHAGPVSFKIYSQGDGITTVFRTVSEDYDRYMKTSLQKALAYSGFDDVSSRFEENTVYSNINGGIGIFGAYIDTKFIADK